MFGKVIVRFTNYPVIMLELFVDVCEEQTVVFTYR